MSILPFLFFQHDILLFIDNYKAVFYFKSVPIKMVILVLLVYFWATPGNAQELLQEIISVGAQGIR